MIWGIEHAGGRRTDDDAVAGLGGELLADALYGAFEVGRHRHLDLVSQHRLYMAPAPSTTTDTHLFIPLLLMFPETKCRFD